MNDTGFPREAPRGSGEPLNKEDRARTSEPFENHFVHDIISRDEIVGVYTSGDSAEYIAGPLLCRAAPIMAFVPAAQRE